MVVDTTPREFGTFLPSYALQGAGPRVRDCVFPVANYFRIRRPFESTIRDSERIPASTDTLRTRPPPDVCEIPRSRETTVARDHGRSRWTLAR